MLHLAGKRAFKMRRCCSKIERLEGEAEPRECESSEANEANLLTVCPPELRELIGAAF